MISRIPRPTATATSSREPRRPQDRWPRREAASSHTRPHALGRGWYGNRDADNDSWRQMEADSDRWRTGQTETKDTETEATADAARSRDGPDMTGSRQQFQDRRPTAKRDGENGTAKKDGEEGRRRGRRSGGRRGVAIDGSRGGRGEEAAAPTRLDQGEGRAGPKAVAASPPSSSTFPSAVPATAAAAAPYSPSPSSFYSPFYFCCTNLLPLLLLLLLPLQLPLNLLRRGRAAATSRRKKTPSVQPNH